MFEITYKTGASAILTPGELAHAMALDNWLVVTRAYYEFPMLPLLLGQDYKISTALPTPNVGQWQMLEAR